MERVIVTPCPMLERTHGPNCPCHRPDSGCEILDLTSSALMKEHGGTGTGGGAEDTPRWGVRGCGGGGGEAACMLYLWKSSNSPGRRLKLLLGSFFLQNEASALVLLFCLPTTPLPFVTLPLIFASAFYTTQG